MSTPESSENGKVSLDELLRLKRAERPAPEFWTRFEQDLRAKQLAAIIEKRPWWVALRVPQLGHAISRWHVPMGAVAVLALSFVGMREYRSMNVSAPVSGVAVTQLSPSNPHPAVGTELVQRAPTELAVASATAVEHANRVVDETTPPLGPSPEVPALAVVVGGSDHAESVVSAEPITTHVALVPQEVIVADSIPTAMGVDDLSSVGFADAAQPHATQLGFDERLELAGLTTNWGEGERAEVRTIRSKPASSRDVRRASIVASWVVADHAGTANQASPDYGQVVNVAGLIDERAYQSAGRIGMGGDRLTLRF